MSSEQRDLERGLNAASDSYPTTNTRRRNIAVSEEPSLERDQDAASVSYPMTNTWRRNIAASEEPSLEHDQDAASGNVVPIKSHGGASEDRDPERDSDAASSNSAVTDTQAKKTPGFTDPNLINGFARATHFLSHDPDRTTVIYRRFDDLSVRNLLFLEGRVAALERLQRELDQDDFFDHKSNTDITTVSASWEEFALLGTAEIRHDGSALRKAVSDTTSEIPTYARKKWREKRLDTLQIIEEVSF